MHASPLGKPGLLAIIRHWRQVPYSIQRVYMLFCEVPHGIHGVQFNENKSEIELVRLYDRNLYINPDLQVDSISGARWKPQTHDNMCRIY